MNIPTDSASEPLPIHHAIDDVTALKIELRRIRQGIEAGIPVAEERVVELEALVDVLAEHLLESRDGVSGGSGA